MQILGINQTAKLIKDHFDIPICLYKLVFQGVFVSLSISSFGLRYIVGVSMLLALEMFVCKSAKVVFKNGKFT